ncbi:MAG: Gldg family protein, partial [Odoribacter sp.]
MVWLICILSENTRNLLKHTDRLIRVDIFLAGNLPAEMQKLQYSLTCMLEEFRRLSGDHFRYEIIDPSEVQDTAEKKALVKYLTDRGIMPVNLNRRTEDETLSQQIIFPGMVVYDKEMEVGINLLQNIPGLSAEQNINHSVEMLEYELTKAIRRLTRKEEKSVAFLTGQGELTYPEVMDMANMLLYYYQVDFVGADSLALDPGRYAALIVAKPTTDFSERDKFIVDQYVMNGGRVLWCVDEVDVEHSLLKNQETIPAVYRPLNIEDLLFRYGVRINPDLLLDGNCVLMPVVTGMNGSTPVYRPGSWYYSPLLVPQTEHSVTSGLQPVRVDYANSIDMVGGEDSLKKTVLLSTSSYTAAMKTPCPVTLSIMEEKMTPDRFNRKFLPVAVAVEGNFNSLFRYRNMSGVVNAPFKMKSDDSRMIVIS